MNDQLKSREAAYIMLLRGINVGGHHKVPMGELKTLLKKEGFSQLTTLLNSGNVIGCISAGSVEDITGKVEKLLEKHFGFSIPALIRKAHKFQEMVADDPFNDITLTKDLRFYVTFLQRPQQQQVLDIPWISEDRSFRIIKSTPTEIYSVLDITKGKTTKGMEILKKTYGKNITTRNWKTLLKINKALLHYHCI